MSEEGYTATELFDPYGTVSMRIKIYKNSSIGAISGFDTIKEPGQGDTLINPYDANTPFEGTYSGQNWYTSDLCESFTDKNEIDLQAVVGRSNS